MEQQRSSEYHQTVMATKLSEGVSDHVIFLGPGAAARQSRLFVVPSAGPAAGA
jgi:hypothetical protein